MSSTLLEIGKPTGILRPPTGVQRWEVEHDVAVLEGNP